jgi:hypothetical protein
MQVPSHIKVRNNSKEEHQGFKKICKESTLQKEEVGGRSHHV